MQPVDLTLDSIFPAARSRPEAWSDFIRHAGVRHMAEIGVFRGEFAAALLAACDGIETYYLVDPWRHLDDWNKPANVDDERFSDIMAEALDRTAFAEGRRRVLRGRTVDVIDGIPDGQLDFAYIDGDHTLRGIAIDLLSCWPKIRVGGFLGGDDFTSTIWQHDARFEPSMVFPFAVHFAEAVGARLHALPNAQFLMQKSAIREFSFVDHVGGYGSTSLRRQMMVSPRGSGWRQWLRRWVRAN